MRLNELAYNSHNPLLESVVYGLTFEQKYIVEGIVNEVRLSMDQINQLFGQVQQGAAAAGGNRTLVGKGVDAGRAANDILNKMGTWLKNTTPVQNFDQKFKDLKANIRQNLGDNSTVVKTVDALGQFAKENPMKTAAIVGVLTAVAGLATGPAGGAIAGQVLRGSVELLKGSDLSTAIGKGAKTAAVGAALGALAPSGTPSTGGAGKVFTGAASSIADIDDAEGAVRAIKNMIKAGKITDYNSLSQAIGKMAQQIGGDGSVDYSDIELAINGEVAKAGGGKFKGNVLQRFLDLNAPEGADTGTAKVDAARGQLATATGNPAPVDTPAATPNAAQGTQATTAAIAPGQNTSQAIKDAVSKSIQAATVDKGDVMGAGKAINKAIINLVKSGVITDPSSYQSAMTDLTRAYGDQLGGGVQHMKLETLLNLNKFPSWTGGGKGIANQIQQWIEANGGTVSPSGLSSEIQAKIAANPPDTDGYTTGRKITKENAYIDYGKTYQHWRLNESRGERIKIFLNQEGINTVFQLVSEGLWDKAKQAAKNVAGKAVGAVANKAAQVGSNLTNKVTADKLMTTWKKYGAPSESDKIYTILTKAGVDEKIVQQVYSDMKIAAPGAQAAAEPAQQAGDQPAGAPVGNATGQPQVNVPAGAKPEPITVGKEKIMPNDPRYAKLSTAVSKAGGGQPAASTPAPAATTPAQTTAKPTPATTAAPAANYGAMKPTSVTAKPTPAPAAPAAAPKPMSYSGQVKATLGQPAPAAPAAAPKPNTMTAKASGNLGNQVPNYPTAKPRVKVPAKGVPTAEAKKITAKNDPCWTGYHMVGTKKKDGREVPNCVPGKKGADN